MARTRTTFDKGTAPKGRGGKRAGSGRKPDRVRHVLDDLLTEPVKGGKARGRSLVKLAKDLILQALTDRDEAGRVTMAGVRAAETVWDRAFGKARQTVEVSGHVGGLAENLTAAERAAAEGALDDVLG